MDVGPSLILTVLLTLANGYFSMAEMALSTAKRVLLEHEAQEGNIPAGRVLLITKNESDFLAAIQVGITLLGFLSSALAATSLSEPLACVFRNFGWSAQVSYIVATACITLIVSYFSIVIGELVPKRIALSNPEAIAKSVSGFMTHFLMVSRPLVVLTSVGAQAISKIIGVSNEHNRQDASEDEIRYLVNDSGELSDEEKSMIHDIFDLADTIAREVMIPRVDMCALEDTSTVEDVLSTMRTTGYSRVPIYHGEVDHIVGIAHIKDLIAALLDKHAAAQPISGFIREADFYPDTKDIIPLLSEMRSSHDQMVIVVDEYGGTAGIITIEDIVEEIVGEIEDEFDPDNKYLTKLAPNKWLVDGRFSVDDARELGWPIEDDPDYETIAGFVLNLADGLPAPGDVFIHEGYEFRVQSMRRTRVSTVRVRALPAPSVADDAK
ncbi:hypothetical protein HMPREF9248_0448 [Fannyhessea vaginae PB189-T1-4]|uniref:CBS domain protein n=1 Tax=Fannyhessea vaginae PB189-T1-4 TaxID=866774 RepID=A0ABN0B0W9_9ACTN|nr:hemolysin family protein [Fannyhessea vaginae]EFL44445.1 hypothetical protein HMPREF9248_0448 [Fannyhessea vaginae PB189-T1-4]